MWYWIGRMFSDGDEQPTALKVFPPRDETESTCEDRMLLWFEFQHLPMHLQDVSQPFAELATFVDQHIPRGPERTVAFRKLLEAKDAAVRAAVRPGG